MQLSQHDISMLLAHKTGKNIAISGIATDSRSVAKGNAFFCLKGDNFDGHDFIEQVIEQGASLVVVSQELEEELSVPSIFVPDTLVALGQVAEFLRDKTSATVIAITGTAGKTTIKEMLASILEQDFSVLKNHKNFNNQIGVPQTIFTSTGSEDFWILELGISKPNDMHELACVVKPDIVLIHNIGSAHLLHLKDIENIAHEKTTLLSYIAPNGKAFINEDYPLLKKNAEDKFPSVSFFSNKNANSACFLDYLGVNNAGEGIYLLKNISQYTSELSPENGKKDEIEICLPLIGASSAENYAAIFAICNFLKIPLKQIISGLQKVQNTPQRFQITRENSWTIIDDTYNANPLSMKASLLNVKEISKNEPLILLLGAMNELGVNSSAEHKNMITFVNNLNAHKIYYYGKHWVEHKHLFQDNAQIMKDEKDFSRSIPLLKKLPSATLFAKGSRSYKMERFLQLWHNNTRNA